MLVEDNDIISKYEQIADSFWKQFINAVKNLKIPEIEVNNVENISDTIDIAIGKYANHPSVFKIKEKVTGDGEFIFQRVSEEEVLNQFKNLKTNFKNIPGKILKEHAYIYYQQITSIIHDNLDNNTFPDTLKQADVYPVFKDGDRTNVQDYRPVSVLTYA